MIDIRATGARIAAYVWFAITVLNLVDLAFGITGTARLSVLSVSIAVVLLLGCGIAYAVGLRPAIVGDDEGVVIRNPLRDTRAPWPAVRAIEGTHVLAVRFAGPDGAERKTRAWVHQTSPRAQAKAERRAGLHGGRAHLVRGRTPAGYAAERLNDLWDRQRPTGRTAGPAPTGAGTVTWSVPALAALGVPLVALAVLAAVAAVS
ncbi:PH domain-containing protein [Spirillospora albida]|uniref:PH domain-containing protein n=1 Tax=Spirillospora albida TaxID=58123 RepID=UPI0004C116C3|nr:PH domain-containing protein [Spirillospora albida]